MTPEAVFLICNYGVLPAWVMLVVAPNAAWTQSVVHRVWIPMGLGLVYVWAFVANPGTPEGGSFQTLAGVMRLFDSPHLTVAGWVHYLAFDLFVGAWEARDAQRRGIGRALLIESSSTRPTPISRR